MSNRPIDLPQPKVLPGDDVLVWNYRRRPEALERGTVVEITLSLGLRSHDLTITNPRWAYEVRLHRLSWKGNFIRLTVGDIGLVE